uniref:Uncharacterized protein n=1 Tax=Leersia perrieri TaxID=77586 RepID=A0A0D9VJE7_9ORYZ
MVELVAAAAAEARKKREEGKRGGGRLTGAVDVFHRRRAQTAGTAKKVIRGNDHTKTSVGGR